MLLKSRMRTTNRALVKLDHLESLAITPKVFTVCGFNARLLEGDIMLIYWISSRRSSLWQRLMA